MSAAPTLLFLHAHPDDECILTGATLATASALGFRTLVAYASRGDAGETNKDLGGDTLGDRRTAEALAACEVLGVDRVEWLGYADSGMAETDTNAAPDAFCNADLDEATGRLAALFHRENIDAVVGYDRNGTYGHPDHVQIHHLAHHCARALGAAWVLDATYDREYLAGIDDVGYDEIDENFASPRAELTHFCEGIEAFRTKFEAISHHMSQVPDDFDVEDPDLEGFAVRFGTEWYIAAAIAEEAEWGALADLFRAQVEWSGAPPMP